MTASSGTSRLPTETKRSKPSGTLTRAKRSSPDSGSAASTPSESERPEMYGNGCPGPTASGVRTGKDLALEVAPAAAELLVGAVLDPRDLDPRGRERGRSSRRQRRAWRAGQRDDALADRRERLAAGSGRRPSGRRAPASSSSSEAGDAHHEELVEVLREDRRELDALEERERVVLGELEDARVVLEPRELAVQETRPGGIGADRHVLMVRE